MTERPAETEAELTEQPEPQPEPEQPATSDENGPQGDDTAEVAPVPTDEPAAPESAADDREPDADAAD